MRTLLFFIFLSQQTYGQLSGKLVTIAGEPVPFANVVLYRDSSIIKATLTDEQGAYRFADVSAGRYMLRVSSIGYHNWESAPFAFSGIQDMGPAALSQDTRVLGEVVVQASKPLIQQQTGGMVVNVENSVLTKGSTALAVLERSPGVLIDSRNNNISLNGKTGVMVMMNGKLVRMTVEQVITLLGSMPADNIEKIELLTTPPARYDAEGSAGLINIVLKKNSASSITLTAGYGKGEKASGSLNLSRKNLYGMYSFSHDHSYGGFTGEGEQYVKGAGENMHFTFNSITKPVTNTHNVTVGYEGATIGGSVNYNNSLVTSESFHRGTYAFESDSFFRMNADNTGRNKWRNFITSAYVKGKHVSIDIDYLNYNNSNPTQATSNYYDKDGNNIGPVFDPLHRGYSNTAIQVGVARVDYTKAFSDWTLDLGVKGSYTTNTSESGIETLQNGKWEKDLSNDVRIREGIGAAYASVRLLSSLVIGARYEYTASTLRNFGKLFPNVSYSKQFGPHELQLSYTKRISRPSYNDLASYVFYIDPFSVFTGNPSLKPAITDKVKLGYNYRNYTFSLLFSSDQYSIVQSQLSSSPLTDLVYVGPQNIRKQKGITLQANLPFKIGSWWDMNYSISSGWQNFKLDYTVHPVDKTYFTYNINFTETFHLPSRFIVELSGRYSAPSYYGTIKVDARAMLNAGIKRGPFQLSVADPLRISSFHTYYGKLTEEIYNGNNNVVVKPESSFFPVIKVTYTRTFGGTAKQQRESANDEKERIRN